MIMIMCIIISIILASCSAQTVSDDNVISKSTSDVTDENDIVKNEPTKSEDNDVTKAEPYNDGSDIEKVILSYLGQQFESTYDEDSIMLLNEIKNCKDQPEALMADKIGEIKIKYKNNDEYISFATLYIGTDHSLYAKYISDTDDNYAYKIDEQTLNKG